MLKYSVISQFTSSIPAIAFRLTKIVFFDNEKHLKCACFTVIHPMISYNRLYKINNLMRYSKFYPKKLSKKSHVKNIIQKFYPKMFYPKCVWLILHLFIINVICKQCLHFKTSVVQNYYRKYSVTLIVQSIL